MQHWLGSRRATAVAIALALALAAASLARGCGGGFVTDDAAFRAMAHSISATSPYAPAPWDLFRFHGGDPAATALAIRTGHLAWWAAPDLELHFLRPLTSLLFVADDALFGDAPLAYHLHSLLWFAVLLVGVAALFRRILEPPIATLAVLAFGLAGANADGYAWLSARHVLVGAAGVAWALALCARGGRVRWLGLVALAIGLAGSEGALGGVPLWCALVWSEPGDASRGRRLARMAPAIAVGIAYLAIYAGLGFGTRGSGGYHDPLADPGAYLATAAVRVPVLLGDALLSVPAELAFVVAPGVLVAIGLAGVVLTGAAWKLAGADRRVAWLALGGVVALLPGLAGMPAGRVLVVPNLAFAALIATIVYRAIASRRPLAIVLASVLAFAHAIVAPLAAVHTMHGLAKKGAVADRIAREVAALVPRGGRAFLLASADPYVFLYPRGVLAETNPGAVTCWSTLSAAHGRHLLTPISPHAFALEARDTPLLAGFDTLFRDPARDPVTAGDTVSQCGADIRVDAVDGAGHPTRLVVTFKRRLADPMLTFLAIRRGADGPHAVRVDPLGLVELAADP